MSLAASQTAVQQKHVHSKTNARCYPCQSAASTQFSYGAICLKLFRAPLWV